MDVLLGCAVLKVSLLRLQRILRETNYDVTDKSLNMSLHTPLKRIKWKRNTPMEMTDSP